MVLHYYHYRGDEFRTVYASLGELRSIIPSSVHIMALTATATHRTFEVVSERLSLCDPVIVGLSPNRPNIFLSMIQPIPLVELAKRISDDLKKERLNYAKTVIFCRSYQDCANLYACIVQYLGKDKTEPPGYPNVLENRVITMYTRASTTSMKEIVLSIFSQDQSILRVLIATTAFSMGVDIANVHQIIHWGAPSDLEQYLQEIGRAGRDGKNSHATLIRSNNNCHAQKAMKNYCDNNDKCRRVQLFESFILYEKSSNINCMCCDVCKKSCHCNVCSNN